MQQQAQDVVRAPLRDELDDANKWDLCAIFPDMAAWQNAVQALQSSFAALRQLQGTLSQTAQALERGMKSIDDAQLAMEKIYVYARMLRDQDNANPDAQRMADAAMSLNVQLSTALSFVTPELSAIPGDTIEDWLAQYPPLSLYAHALRDLQRVKPHVLDEPQEKLLAMAGELAQAPGNIFKMLNNADLRFGNVTDAQGQAVEITHGRYVSLMESPDRRVREEAYTKLYDAYKGMGNTLAATYAASVKKDVFYAQVRGHKSARAASLFSDNVPEAVYDSLIDATHDNLPALHRYFALRKRVLGVEQLHMYDLYTPLLPDCNHKIEYQKACRLLLEAVAPLGAEYTGIVKKGLTGGWVDVYENRGKTSGAYSWGAYGSHPYVLLNYQPNVDNAFTLAHEMGHALHSYLSDEAQAFPNAGYAILVAEVASTVNELLLLRHMLNTTHDPSMRLFLLNHYLEQFRGTVYRQAMFAEFERWSHAQVETGAPLTLEGMCAHYKDLCAAYHGPAMHLDDAIAYEWARIPHFYTAFYVYKYATGFSAAVDISARILQNEQGAVDAYLRFLRGGGSDYPLALLQGAGVDLTDKRPVNACMREFARALAEFEELLGA